MEVGLAGGIAVCIFILVVFALLVIFLLWQEVPRHAGFQIAEISATIYAASVVISYEIAERLVLNGGDSLLIYVAPVVPVVIYVVWASRRAKKKSE